MGRDRHSRASALRPGHQDADSKPILPGGRRRSPPKYAGRGPGLSETWETATSAQNRRSGPGNVLLDDGVPREWEPQKLLYVQHNLQDIPFHRQLRLARQAVEALAVLHAVDVVHCDLSPRNFLLDSDLELKISDSGGSSIFGSESSAAPATGFRRPGYDFDASPVPGDDIFSVGSLIYFIRTGVYPYGEIPSEEVEKRYETGRFPDTTNVPCGHIILDCWHRRVHTAQAILDSLETVKREAL